MPDLQVDQKKNPATLQNKQVAVGDRERIDVSASFSWALELDIEALQATAILNAKEITIGTGLIINVLLN